MSRKVAIIALAIAISLSSSLGFVRPSRADTYRGYYSLASRQDINSDYRIISRDRGSDTAILAIHGGKIEFGTDEVATAVARQGGYNLYVFAGIKPAHNGVLHITSTRFNEPTARKLVARSEKTLAVHGCSGKSRLTYIGGQDKELGKKVEKHLEKAGFKVRKAPGHLDGKKNKNICNRNASGAGVQLELTRAMRQSLLSGGEEKPAFKRYTAALAAALAE